MKTGKNVSDDVYAGMSMTDRIFAETMAGTLEAVKALN